VIGDASGHLSRLARPQCGPNRCLDVDASGAFCHVARTQRGGSEIKRQTACKGSIPFLGTKFPLFSAAIDLVSALVEIAGVILGDLGGLMSTTAAS
jgi:hypothetical protein